MPLVVAEEGLGFAVHGVVMMIDGAGWARGTCKGSRLVFHAPARQRDFRRGILQWLSFKSGRGGDWRWRQQWQSHNQGISEWHRVVARCGRRESTRGTLDSASDQACM
jgi:hypothetical protein